MTIPQQNPATDKVIYKGQRMDLLLRSVTTGSGKQIVREVVWHPGAVIILPVLHDGNIVMIKNLRHTLGEELWELPAGTLEKGEDPAICASRELEEETGYSGKNIKSLGWFYTSPGILTEKMFAFLATDLQAGPQALEENETITVVPLSPSRIKRMITDNEIVDGKTIAVLLRYLMTQGR